MPVLGHPLRVVSQRGLIRSIPVLPGLPERPCPPPSANREHPCPSGVTVTLLGAALVYQGASLSFRGYPG